MNRPRYTAAVFVLAVAAVFGGMAWVTVTALRLDATEYQARRHAANEEKIRLALWRLDSAVSPLIVQESMRPYFEYSPFYSAERAYTKMFAEISPGEVLVPSPLLTLDSPYIHLHFQSTADGFVTSPQVPESNMRDVAESGYVTTEWIEAHREKLAALRGQIEPLSIRAALLGAKGITASALIKAEEAPQQAAYMSNSAEFERRVEVDQSIKQSAPTKNVVIPKQKVASPDLGATYEFHPNSALGVSRMGETASPSDGMQAIWIRGELYLAREVSVDGKRYIQGCWMNWPELRESLGAQILDVLPNASLTPIETPDEADPQRMLASIPVRLADGLKADGTPAGWTPIRAALVIAWLCVIPAGLAIAGLLWGAVSLSERRGAFVSAVTHELRTPLTTFRMYTEMLSSGIVADEEKRKSYLQTLARESARLTHLVENVLAYARLERGRTGSNFEAILVRELAERMRPSIEERCKQAQMPLAISVNAEGCNAVVRTNASAVEQIVMNLVDNSCKYARNGNDARIELTFETADRHAIIRVRDQGPGLPPAVRRKLFKPFSKSAHEAAESAPGVGLGLALSRRLARNLGGDLVVSGETGAGCVFEVRLPVDRQRD